MTSLTALEDIGKDIRENKTEAKSAVPIGTTAICLCVSLFSVTVLLDVTKLKDDVISGWKNFRKRMAPRRSNSTKTPRNLSLITLSSELKDSP